MQQPELIGESWESKIDFKQNDILFEYYMRRGNKFYFRNKKSKIVVDNEYFKKSFLGCNPKYGEEFEINFNF